MRICFGLVMALLVGFAQLSFANAKEASKIDLKWRLVHGPRVYAEYTANKFAENLGAKVGNKIKVDVDNQSQSPRIVRDNLNNQVIPQLKAGELQIAQVYLTEFSGGDDLFQVLAMPFLFNDHEHVTKVVEGPIGRRLLDGLHAQGLTAFAFSYSGGYQNFLSAKKLSFKNDNIFAGLSVGNIGDFLRKGLDMIGPKQLLTQVQMSEHQNNYYVGKGMEDASLETYSDMDYFYNEYAGNRDLYFYGANFNVLFTALVMSDSYFKSLPVKYQQAIRESAQAAARAERMLVIDDSKKFRDQLMSGAVTNPHIHFVDVAGDDLAGLRKASMKSYELLNANQKALVDEIRHSDVMVKQDDLKKAVTGASSTSPDEHTQIK